MLPDRGIDGYVALNYVVQYKGQRLVNDPLARSEHAVGDPSADSTQVSSGMEFREITAADVPALFDVRTKTRENRYTLEELEGLAITVESVVEKLAASHKGWLCAQADQVVGFCIADGSTGELWVVAVLPEYEGLGIGNRLTVLAEDWLRGAGRTRAWLTTDIDTALRAYGFYRHRGWTDWKVENGLRWMELGL